MNETLKLVPKSSPGNTFDWMSKIDFLVNCFMLGLFLLQNLSKSHFKIQFNLINRLMKLNRLIAMSKLLVTHKYLNTIVYQFKYSKIVYSQN
jgi:hypothetical protein